MSGTPTARKFITQARLRAAGALFVCLDCALGSRRRREFKRVLKALGRKRDLRIVGCRCLDLCPKRGTATMLARAQAPARCAIVDDGADAEIALGQLLLDEGVGDAVAD